MPTPRRGGWIQTYTGIPFYPLDPRPEDISILDIAHALSMKCRYAGHCQDFYSVAEHSILLSKHAPPEAALWALLHDASEAYLPDVPRPIKASLEGFAGLEARIMEVVAEVFRLGPMPEIVHELDTRILHDESELLMGPKPHPWNIPGTPLGVKAFACLAPQVAERVFLTRFHDLIWPM